MNHTESYNNANGKRLRQVLWTVTDSEGLDAGVQKFNNRNWDGDKVQEYQTFFNAKQKFDSVLNCKFSTDNVNGSDDWKYNQDSCDDTLISNEAVYKLNWFHIDRFSSDKVDSPNIEEGLILSDKDLNYKVQMKVPASSESANVTLNMFFTYLRNLIISAKALNGVMLEGEGSIISV